jgi:hypothetical protein
LQQDVVVTAFAEHLRGAPWGDIGSLSIVAERAALLPSELLEDPAISELIELVARAERLGA